MRFSPRPIAFWTFPGLCLLFAPVGCQNDAVRAAPAPSRPWGQAAISLPVFVENYTSRNLLLSSSIDTFNEVRRVGDPEWFAPDTAGKIAKSSGTEFFATVPDNQAEVLSYNVSVAIGNDSPSYALVQLSPQEYRDALDSTGCRVIFKPLGIRVFVGKKTWRLNWIRPFPKVTLEPNYVSPRRAPKL